MIYLSNSGIFNIGMRQFSVQILRALYLKRIPSTPDLYEYKQKNCVPFVHLKFFFQFLMQNTHISQLYVTLYLFLFDSFAYFFIYIGR